VRVMSFRVSPEDSGQSVKSRARWVLMCVAFLFAGLLIGLHRTPPAPHEKTSIAGGAASAGLITWMPEDISPALGEDTATLLGLQGRKPDAGLGAQEEELTASGSAEKSRIDPQVQGEAQSVQGKEGKDPEGSEPSTESELSTRPEIRLTTYTVKSGDTLSAIAAKFNTSTSSIAYINDLSSPDFIKPGMELKVIENASGVLVTVSPGDTLWDISRGYGVPIAEIAYVNNLDVTAVLKVGTQLIVPGASFRYVPVVSRSSSFRWPIKGTLTSSYGWRTHPITGERSFHEGLDIAASYGTAVGAAAGGKVTFAGWNGGYGRLVIIDHGDGVETRYGHLSSIAVSTGQYVSSGETIGYVGQSGDATGPHLHFEMRKNGKTVDPRDYLP